MSTMISFQSRRLAIVVEDQIDVVVAWLVGALSSRSTYLLGTPADPLLIGFADLTNAGIEQGVCTGWLGWQTLHSSLADLEAIEVPSADRHRYEP